MRHENHIEREDAQTKNSRKSIKQGEVSTVTDIKQVDNQATADQQLNPVSDKIEPDKKENYFTNSENSDSDSFDANFITTDDLTEELLAYNETGDAAFQDGTERTASEEEQEEDSIDEFIEDTPSIYFLRAKKLYDCKDSHKIQNLAVKTIRGVHRNIKTGWLLMGIAAYNVRRGAEQLAGGAGNTDDLKTGRVNAVKKLAEKCAAAGAPISFSRLYDYSHWVEVLLEEPLKKFAGDKKTIRRERIVLMEKLFTLPPDIAKTLSTGTAASQKVKIAAQLEKDLGRAARNSELKTAISQYFKTKNGAIAGAENKDGDDAGAVHTAFHLNENGNDDDSDDFESEDVNDLALSRDEDDSKIESNSHPGGFFASHISREAKRVKVKPEKVKDLYVSFLQMMLSSIKDMGIKK